MDVIVHALNRRVLFTALAGSTLVILVFFALL